jgi:hypothetical protein
MLRNKSIILSQKHALDIIYFILDFTQADWLKAIQGIFLEDTGFDPRYDPQTACKLYFFVI